MNPKVLGVYLAPDKQTKRIALDIFLNYFPGLVFSEKLANDKPPEAFIIREMFPPGFKEQVFYPVLIEYGIRKIG